MLAQIRSLIHSLDYRRDFLPQSILDLFYDLLVLLRYAVLDGLQLVPHRGDVAVDLVEHHERSGV